METSNPLGENEIKPAEPTSGTRVPTHPRLDALPRRAARLQAPDMSSSSCAASGPIAMRQRMARLLHAAIDPAVATAVLDEAGDEASDGAGEVVFDGLGRISGFGERGISPSLAERLENAVVESLTRTNAPGPRGAARTERELLTRAMHLLRNASGASSARLMADAKTLFLSGGFSRDTVAAFFTTAAGQLAGNDLLEGWFERLSSEISLPVAVAQRADNIYGRTFESLLVDDLIRDPPAGVLGAAGDLGKAMLDILNSHLPAVREALRSRLLHYVNADRRFWIGSSATLQRFLEAPSMNALQACLEEASDGVESIKMPFIATQLALAIQDLDRDDRISRPRWLQRSDSFYGSFLRPQKPKQKSRFGGVHASGPGNWLHHQPRGETMKFDGQGKSWTHERVVQPKRLSRFEEDALARGQGVVNGPSGTTSLMFFLGEHIAGRNPGFSEAGHHLNTLMFLVFDGGHSTHEVLATLNAIRVSSGRGATRASKKAAVASFGGGYAAIADLAGSEAGRQALRTRLDSALERTIDYFATYVARAGEADPR